MMNWTSIELIYKVLPIQQTSCIHGLRMKRTRVAGNIYEQPAEMIIRATCIHPILPIHSKGVLRRKFGCAPADSCIFKWTPLLKKNFLCYSMRSTICCLAHVSPAKPAKKHDEELKWCKKPMSSGKECFVFLRGSKNFCALEAPTTLKEREINIRTEQNQKEQRKKAAS